MFYKLSHTLCNIFYNANFYNNGYNYNGRYKSKKWGRPERPQRLPARLLEIIGMLPL